MAAAALRRPCLATVGRAENRAQLSYRPTALAVDELDAVQRHRLAGRAQFPRFAMVRTVQYYGTGPAYDPNLVVDAMDGMEIEARQDIGRQRALAISKRGRAPLRASAVAANQHQPAIADGNGPVAVHLEPAYGAAAERIDIGRRQIAAPQDRQPVPGAS